MKNLKELRFGGLNGRYRITSNFVRKSLHYQMLMFSPLLSVVLRYPKIAFLSFTFTSHLFLSSYCMLFRKIWKLEGTYTSKASWLFLTFPLFIDKFAVIVNNCWHLIFLYVMTRDLRILYFTWHKKYENDSESVCVFGCGVGWVCMHVHGKENYSENVSPVKSNYGGQATDYVNYRLHWGQRACGPRKPVEVLICFSVWWKNSINYK